MRSKRRFRHRSQSSISDGVRVTSITTAFDDWLWAWSSPGGSKLPMEQPSIRVVYLHLLASQHVVRKPEFSTLRKCFSAILTTVPGSADRTKSVVRVSSLYVPDNPTKSAAEVPNILTCNTICVCRRCAVAGSSRARRCRLLLRYLTQCGSDCRFRALTVDCTSRGNVIFLCHCSLLLPRCCHACALTVH